MGPKARYMGPEVPKEDLIWQDPVPAVDHPVVDEADIQALKAEGASLRAFGLRAGFDGMGFGFELPRLRQARRRERRAHSAGSAEGLEGNQPEQLARVLEVLEEIQGEFNGSAAGGKKISLADLIVLGGAAAVEKAAKDAGIETTVPFTPGRTDASQEQTDAESFAPLEPKVDGFRSYGYKDPEPAEVALLDKAQLMRLTAPELTVLIGGLRVLNTNFGGTKFGVFTDRPETLTNDFFVNLLDMKYVWKATDGGKNTFEGRERKLRAR